MKTATKLEKLEKNNRNKKWNNRIVGRISRI